MSIKYGHNYSETLYGTSSDDTIYGNDGNDTIYGDSGNDIARGGLGNDSLNKGDGFMNGGSTIDLLTVWDSGGVFSVDHIGGMFSEVVPDGSGSDPLAVTPAANDVQLSLGESTSAGSAAANEVANDDLASPLPNYTLNEIGDYVREDFWDWFETQGGSGYYRSFNITSSGTGANSNTIYYNYSGFSGITGAGTDTDGMTAARQALVDDALAYLEEITGINFVQTTSQADHVDIFYKDNASGAFSNSSLFGSGNGADNHRYIDYSWVNVASSWSGGTSDINDYTYQTIIHETLHALGLGHSGSYNGTVNYITDWDDYSTTGNNNCYLNDCWSTAIMSYIDQTTNTTIDADYNYVITLMPGDFEALRDYYGSSEAFNGGTVYGFNTNISDSVSEVMADLSTYADETAFCIIDSSGTDTVDFSGYAADQIIDLTVASGSSITGTVSDIGGQEGNMALGVGTVIENAVGGSGADTITGNDYDNTLTGNAGNDTIYGEGGEDTLHGGAGNDTLLGGYVTDTVYGDDGDDVIRVLAGEYYDNSYGGAGTDTLDHSASDYTGETFDFASGLIIEGTDQCVNGTTAVLNSIEIYQDGSGGNTIISDGDGYYYGNGGDDYMTAGVTVGYVPEVLNGGAGTDTLDTTPVSTGSYTINMATGVTSWAGESFINFENLNSGGTVDTITGTSVANIINTGAGDDVVYTGNGDDTVYGGIGNDTIYGEGYWDTIYGGDGNDTLLGGTGTDTVYGDDGDDVIRVLAGEYYDNSYGGAGTDTLDHSASDYSGETFDFASGLITEGGDPCINGTSAVLNSIEIYRDGSGGNTIISDGDGYYYGNGGSDYMTAGLTPYLGTEILDGGAGNDTLDTTPFSTSGVSYVINMVTGLTNYTGESFINFERLISGGTDDTITGTTGDNDIYSNAGNDVIDGNGGADWMYGGTGDDTYVIDSTSDVVYEGGGQGTDRVNAYVSDILDDDVENLYLYGTAINGFGNSLDNEIYGNSNDNVLSGIEGNDSLYGDEGNDSLYGGSDNDTLYGGSGGDYLDGMTGDDTMAGGTGDDTYVIDSTSDVVYEGGGQGTDRVNAYVSDILDDDVENLYLYGTAIIGFGNSLNNEIYGNSNDNSLSGIGGNDSLYGNEGNDTLYGGAGNDYLDGMTGNDTMAGGTGDDTYYVDSASDVVTEASGEGTDTVNTSINYTLGSDVENLSLYGTAVVGIGNDLGNVIVGNSTDDVLCGLAGSDTLNGVSGNDTMVGGAGDDTLNGGTGNDTMIGGAGDDTYTVDTSGDFVSEAAGEGADTVNSSVSYTLTANVENLTLTGTAASGTGNDLNNVIMGNSSANTLYGNDGNDDLRGGDGNDNLNGGAGDDYMAGGAGNDVYYVDSASDIASEAASAGTDTIYAYVSDTLNPNVENMYLYGTATTGSGNALDNKIVGNSSDNSLYGYDGNDDLRGGDGNDTLNGGAGDDYMAGGAGNDVYYVDSASDIASEAASAGTDTIYAYVSDTLNPNVENMYLYGTATTGSGNALDNKIVGNSSDNSLYGYDGNDDLRGGDGNDTLNGGAGDDYMAGGAGNDVYYVDSASDIASEAASAGTDTIYAIVSDTLNPNVENMYLYGTATTGSGNALDNKIVGNSSDNSLYGYDGNDDLRGGDGNDTLNGGAGNDYMVGGTGDDIYVIDSAGDIVSEAASAGTDTIYATVSDTLNPNVENMYLYGTATTGSGNTLDNTIVGNGSANSLNGYDGADTLYGNAGSDNLNGGAGNDSLVGGSGNDSLYGGTGQDLFVFAESGSANYDTITSFSHTDDTIVLQDILDSVTDSLIAGLTFTGNVLNAGSYFEGAGSTGNGTEASGIYDDTTTGNVWYNPTSSVAGDSVLICTVGSTAAASLDNTDFVYAA